MKWGREGQRRGKEKMTREHSRYNKSYPHKVNIKLTKYDIMIFYKNSKYNNVYIYGGERGRGIHNLETHLCNT